MISTTVSQTDANRLSSTETRRKRTIKKKLLLTAVVFTLLLTGWSQAVSALAPVTVGTLALSPEGRDKLTFEELMAEEYVGDGPIENRYFMPVGESSPALHTFEGTLTVPWAEMENTAPQAAHERNEGLRWFSPFTAQFSTYEDYLVPAERTVLCPSEPHYWCVILSPGKVWSEPGDNGMSRASFPFVLVNEWGQNTHNGLATFLYDDTRVSSLRFQITQETSADRPYQFDAWGQTPVEYTPGPVENREELAAQFAEELARQVPIRPWEDLEEMVAPKLLNRFTDYLAPEDISAAGLVVDGVLYLHPPMTRYGEYPYPRHMRHGVYSVTKSMGAAIAMLRLAQKYGEEMFDLRIADYVEVTADHDGWDDVTFGDALNMATGVGETLPQLDDPNFAGDESEPRFSEFIRARSTHDKLAVSFSYPSYPWGPGEVARYNSINTFVLSAAMDSFLKSKEGPDAHLWDMVSEEVYKPIGVFHLPTMHTVEPDGSRGIPLLFMGLYPTVDDVAKITMLLQNGGQHDGEQLLSAAKLEEALYRRGLVGLPTGYKFTGGDWAYHLSFHSVAYRTRDRRYFQVPFMSGLGGNTVVAAPNGISGFVFTDAYIAEPYIMTQVIEALRPFPGEGVEVGRFTLVPKGIYALQGTRQLLFIFDRVLLVWFILTAVSLAFFIYDQVRGMPATWAMRLVWLLVVVFLGPLGLLAYLLPYRQPGRAPDLQAAMTNGRRALGATVYSVAGYAIAMILLHVLFNTITVSVFDVGPVIALAVMYGLPFIIGLLIFRAPLVASLMRDGYWGVAVRRSLLAEVISVNLMLTGAIPVLLIPNSRYPLVFGPASPPTFGLFSLAAIASVVIIYPFNAWMVRRGFSVWPIRVVVGRAFAQEEDTMAMPSLRNAWGALLLSFVLLIASLGLTMLSLL